MRKEYEKNMSIKYDLVLLQESYNYLFEKLDFDIFYNNKLNILGYWDFDKKIPDFFNHPSSGHLQIPSIYDIIVISNNKLIDQYCNLFFKIKKYIEEPIPVCSYKSFNYHKAEYVIYRYLIDSKIKFEKINLLSGVIRNNKVKVMLSICPEDKINYVNDLKRNDFVLSDDARDYITF